MSLEQIKRRIVRISVQGKPEASGLGIVSNNRIFTCAHILPVLGIGPFDYSAFDVTRVASGKTCIANSYVGLSCDFMLLAEDALQVKSDDGPEGDWHDVFYCESEDTLPDLNPARCDIPVAEGVDVEGYFFRPDGVTEEPVTYSMSSEGLFIDIHRTETSCCKGSSGGPLMTADHKLIGIVLGQFGDGTYPMIRAIRIDLVVPEFLRRELDWEPVSFLNLMAQRNSFQ